MKPHPHQDYAHFHSYLDWYGKHGQICKAALLGNLSHLQAALQDPEVISQRLLRTALPASGLSPFLYACMGDKRAIVTFLLKQGVNINERDRKGASAVMLACYYGHELLARQLIKQGADIFPPNHRGNTLAMAASTGGLEDLALHLLDLGIEAHPAPPRKGNLLNFALLMMQTRLARRLIAEAKTPALLNDAGGRQYTPLLSACNSGLFSLATDLIERSAHPFACNNRGDNALYISCANRHSEPATFCQKLIGLGFDPNLSASDHSCLMAASCRNYLNTVKILLQAGADINKANRSGQTALYFAKRFQYKALEKFLVQAGAVC